MASSFPNLGRAPSLPSRIVTVDLAETHIGQPETGAKVDFTLPQDIHVRADGVIVQAGTVTLELDATGRGEIRLPCYSSASKPEDWVILVKKHWAPYSYPIRVPAGTTKISLASLEPPVEVPDAMSKFVPTDAVVRSIKEGAQWSASAEVDGGIINLDFVVPPGGVAYARGALTPEDNLDTLEDGVYRVTSAATAVALGLPTNAPGSVTSRTVFNSPLAKTQQYDANMTNGGPARSWARQALFGIWGPWTRMDAGALDPATLTASADLNQVTKNGQYIIRNLSISNRPPTWMDVFGALEVLRFGPTSIFQRFTAGFATPEIWVRRSNDDGATWDPWTQIGALDPATSDSEGPVRHDLLKQGLQARKGGRIGTSGRGVVSLRFDDAAGDFTRNVLPLLEERGLPFTRVTTLDRLGNPNFASIGEAGEGSSWEDLQAACIEAGGEVFNHGKTHGYTATTTAQIDEEIVGALSGIRANLPRLVVDCFTPPGGSGGWGGHLPSETVEDWADTYAGRLIWGHHALSTGYGLATSYHPLDGVIRDGQVHFTADIRNQSYVKNVINQARDWQAGVVLLWHANQIGADSDHMSMDDFVAVLDYLVTQRDAGNLLVLTVSGQAVADKTSDYREDLLTVHAGAGSSFSTSVVQPNWRSGILGSTRELTATVTGAAGTTITSVVSESTKTHVIPAGGILALRHPVTIPTDVNSLPVSITGGAVTDAHLYAV